MGRFIGQLTKKFNKEALDAERKRRLGRILVILTLLCFGGSFFGFTVLFYKLSFIFGTVFEGIVSYQCLAAGSLYKESTKVSRDLLKDDIQKARQSLSMIVGRDTKSLDQSGITRAAVETVAENTSDGVIAPLLFLFLGGPVLGIIYKAVNTMDSMIGYKNEEFIDFGRCAAKLDDIFNFIPARISALLMIAAAFVGGKRLNGRGAYHIWKRDRRKHSSPNSAQCESAAAGALGIRLGALWAIGVIGIRLAASPTRDGMLDVVENLNIHIISRAIHRHQLAQAIIVIVLIGKLEDGLASLLAQPHQGTAQQRVVPLA